MQCDCNANLTVCNVDHTEGDDETYINPYTHTTEQVCECGHRTGKHIYDYRMEEFNGCQYCLTCPSHDRFFERKAK
jgi:hypothetical protein